MNKAETIANELSRYAANPAELPAQLIRDAVAALRVKAAAVRSVEEHNLLFGVVAMAFQNWPHTHPFRPADEEHLRVWLAMEVGHHEIFEVPADCLADTRTLALVGDFFCGGRRLFRIGKIDGQLVVMRPLTMQKKGIPVAKYRAMASAVYEVIQAATGITPELYKAFQEGRRVAA